MSEFTREQLAEVARWSGMEPCPNLAAFALTLLDRAEKAEAERDEANAERDDAVDRWARRAREAEATVKDYLTVQAERDRLREELREAEKRMKAWGCPDFDFICLNCGRETPCITEADLGPGDPGVPCTFDLTYPQMIERLRHYEDRQRKAEAERDEARAMKVPATTEAVTLAEMGEKVARTEAWAAKEELRIAEAERDRLQDLLRRINGLDEKADAASWQQQAEDRGTLALQIAAERDRLQRALDLSEQAHREVREVCERHGVENALRLSVRLESVCDERDRLRAQLDSILANSDSLESGKLADAHAEIKRLREELREAEEAIRILTSLPQAKPITGEAVECVACGQRKAPIGRDAPSMLYLCDQECPGYKEDPRPGFLWPGETLEDFGYPQEAATADGKLRVALQHPAVRRARERAWRG